MHGLTRARGGHPPLKPQQRAEEELRAREMALQQSQEELHLLAGRLLAAQEKERRWLTREMHDDLTQRLAALAIEVGGIEQQLASSMDRSQAPLRPPPTLTPRQREVMQLLAEGHSAKEVAAIMHISTRTAEFHKYRAMEILGLRTSAELIHYAIKHGIVAV